MIRKLLEKFREDRKTVSELIKDPWLEYEKEDSDKDEGEIMEPIPHQLMEMAKFDEKRAFRLVTL